MKRDFRNYDIDELKSNLKLLTISLVLTIVLAIGSICLGGKVVCDMWNWFVVKATGWDEVSYVVGVGLWVLVDGLFISNITSSIKHSIESKESDYTNLTIDFSHIIAILLTWGIGAIVHCCM